MIEHEGVYLRRMATGNHLVALDTPVGESGPDYLEVPPVRERVDTHFGSSSKVVKRTADLTFGDRVRVRLERI